MEGTKFDHYKVTALRYEYEKLTSFNRGNVQKLNLCHFWHKMSLFVIQLRKGFFLFFFIINFVDFTDT